MLTRKNIVLATTMLAAACLPGLCCAAMARPDAPSWDARLTGFARPRTLEPAPGAVSGSVGIHFFRPLFLPVDMVPTPLFERNRSWASGQYTFLRPEWGRGHGHWSEHESDDVVAAHGHGHGHGHDDDHGGTPVPLPAPWTLLSSALLLLVSMRRLAATRE